MINKLNDLTILQLAVLYASVDERLERLNKQYKVDKDIKLKGEIELSMQLLSIIKNEYTAKGGDVNWL